MIKFVKNLQSILVVQLAESLYAINVTGVCHIYGVPEITKVPQTPEYMLGLTNARDGLIPVIDLRILYGMEATTYTKHTAIIVAECSNKNEVDNGFQNLGLLVDNVLEVRDIDTSLIEQPLVFEDENFSHFAGFIKLDDKIVMVLDVDKLFTADSILKLKPLISEDVPI